MTLQASRIRVAVVHDSGWSGDDKPYRVQEVLTSLPHVFTRGFVSFADARRWAIDQGFTLTNEEIFAWDTCY